MELGLNGLFLTIVQLLKNVAQTIVLMLIVVMRQSVILSAIVLPAHAAMVVTTVLLLMSVTALIKLTMAALGGQVVEMM
jgi:hypothetical protein